MLSFERGSPIARIRGGPDDGRILRVDANATEPELLIDDMFDVITSDMFSTSLRKRYDPHVLEVVARAVRRKKPPTEKNLVGAYNAVMEIINDRIGKEYHTGEGVLSQTPNTRLDRECLYVAGPSGSGKSVYTRSYVKNYLERFPGRPVYVFSRVANDRSLLEDLPEGSDAESTYSSDSSEEEEEFEVEEFEQDSSDEDDEDEEKEDGDESLEEDAEDVDFDTFDDVDEM